LKLLFRVSNWTWIGHFIDTYGSYFDFMESLVSKEEILRKLKLGLAPSCSFCSRPGSRMDAIKCRLECLKRQGNG